jgi:hypothetical protein
MRVSTTSFGGTSRRAAGHQTQLVTQPLADDIEQYLGPEARKALLHWHSELLDAINEIQRGSTDQQP